MPERTDFEVSAQDHREYIEGQNEATAKTVVQTMIVGEVTVKQYPARSWSVTKFLGLDNSQVVSIASAIPQRKRLVITNHGANPVYLAPAKENCSVSYGYLLAGGAAPLTMEHSDAVWAICEAAKPTDLSIYAEFRDGGS